MSSSYLGRSCSTSLSNVFGTERYLYMSNNSLKRIIKKKLDFEQSPPYLTARQRYYNDLEIDFEQLDDSDSANSNVNFERITEVCEARLRNVRNMKQKNGSSFLEKLENIKFSRPQTPESVVTSADVAEVRSESSFLNRTRELFSDEANSSKWDSTDLIILEKIDNHSRRYGTVPVLYHKIGEQILNRKDYDNIDFDSPKASCATQTDDFLNDDDDSGTTNHEAETPLPEKENQIPMDSSMERSSSLKTVKNRRNRNFVLENIQKVASKQSLSKNQRSNVKCPKNMSELSVQKRTPSTVKVKSMRRHRKHLKRRSLQFTTDDENDDSTAPDQTPYSVEKSEFLKKMCEEQSDCITKMGDTLKQIKNDVVEIVQLQGEIDSARQNHSEIMALQTAEDCQRVNGGASSLAEGDD